MMFKWVLFDDFESMLLQKLFCFKFILLQEMMRSGQKVFKFFLQNILIYSWNLLYNS